MLDNLRQELRQFGQEHLLQFWPELSDGQRDSLSSQIQGLDLGFLRQLVEGDDEAPDWSELSKEARPPLAFRSDDAANSISRRDAQQAGQAALQNGEVGMILVAGGQGSRLGFDHPKGMFPIGPFSGRTLFQVIIDRLRGMSDRYGKSIPLFLMTSPATDRETVEFMIEKDRFGLAEEDLHVFCQGVMPAVDAATGKILLTARDSLFLSPDGHGGMLSALRVAGLFAQARDRGIKHLFYGQVDNPLLQVCDPALIGYHILAQSEMTTQVVQKVGPEEKVGNVVRLEGQTRIIEYSDLPMSMAQRRNPDKSLYLWAGNMAVHVFDCSFLEAMANRPDSLPVHRAQKNAEFLDETGVLVQPQSTNAVKFEKFIFDLLPAAKNAIVVEAEKKDAFAPVKNASGSASDTPETARAAMIQNHARMLLRAGIKLEPGVVVEVDPLWALDHEEVSRRLATGTHVTESTFFTH